MVEVLSVCPTNWGLTAAEADAWLAENMIPYYKLGVLKRPEEGFDTVAAQWQAASTATTLRGGE